ncbi:hypothetical protein JKY79_01510 [Candidatus Babeliales bacterium]|nr:hypothetical protein [Candidatus Babeliales bacterium]
MGEKATIVILIDKMSQWWANKKVLEIIKEVNIPVYVYQSNFFDKFKGDTPLHLSHSKYIVWKYTSSKNRPLYRLASGSANFTIIGTEKNKNFEQFMLTKLSKKDFKQHKRLLFIAAKDAEQMNPNATDIRTPTIKPIIPNPVNNTPKKGHVTQFSPTDDIIDTIVKRINKTKQDGEITIITYAFDVPLVTDALVCALKKKVKVFIVMDQYGLSRKASEQSTSKQLSQLSQAGAEVFIYKNKGILKNHAKMILINDGKRIVCGHGSYNFTPTSKNSFNTFHWLAKTSASTALNLIVDQWEELMKYSTEFTPHAIESSKELAPISMSFPSCKRSLQFNTIPMQKKALIISNLIT